MLDVAGTIAVFDNPPPSRLRPAEKPSSEEPPVALPKLPKNVEPEVVDNDAVGIVWNAGIEAQGGAKKDDTGWEAYIARQEPNAKRLPPGATGFDLFNEATGEAISAKTMNTQRISYIKNPREIFRKLKSYVNDILEYERIKESDLDSADIQLKTIYLAIPEYTSPEQRRYLLQAIIYG